MGIALSLPPGCSGKAETWVHSGFGSTAIAEGRLAAGGGMDINTALQEVPKMASQVELGKLPKP